MPSAILYADWVVEYCAKEIGAPIDPMSLEKHLYYAQAFCLAVRGRPLFDDDFEAWTHGPVLRDVWRRYSGAAPIGEEPSICQPAFEPDEATRSFLSDVISFVSRLNTFQLSRATHAEAPWNDARGALAPKEHGSSIIRKASMQAYYAGLIEDGEDALSRRALLGELPAPRWGWLYVGGICARAMTDHPLYVHGLSLWGPKARLAEPVGEQPDHARSLFAPPTEEEAAEIEEYASAEEFFAALKRA